MNGINSKKEGMSIAEVARLLRVVFPAQGITQDHIAGLLYTASRMTYSERAQAAFMHHMCSKEDIDFLISCIIDNLDQGLNNNVYWREIYSYLHDKGRIDNECNYTEVLEKKLGKEMAGRSNYNYREALSIMGLFLNSALGTAFSVGKIMHEMNNDSSGENNVKNDSKRGGYQHMREYEANSIQKWIDIIKDLWAAQSEGNETGEVSSILDFNLQETGEIVVPNKMDLYTDLDVTEKDRIDVQFTSRKKFNDLVLLINGEDTVVGVFTMRTYYTEEDGEIQLLTAEKRDLLFGTHRNSRYYFVFSDQACNMYKVPIEVSYKELEKTSTHLCIDFGTSNTTVGCFLDDKYVSNVSNLAKINENIELNALNIAKFPVVSDEGKKGRSLSYSILAPTMIYVDHIDCESYEVYYLFGHDAAEKIKTDNYCPKASCFMEIKKWTSNIDEDEEVQDEVGNKATVSRKDIIAAYLNFVIDTAESQFKCRFENIHISAPVKLKDKVLKIYEEILKQSGYVLERDHAIDEGIAVLYSIINNQIKEGRYENGYEEKALIIDCGGGTSDLASCRYTIEKDEDGIINLDINTEYMNGDVNFGGNNLTYRIMQYMKIVYAIKYLTKKRRKIDDLIDLDVSSIFSYIEGEDNNDDDAKVKERYEEVYKKFLTAYDEVEKVIPTHYQDFENRSAEIYDRVKNNFYFLWKLAEEMKKEFYKTTSIVRYTFERNGENNTEIDLHVNTISNWRLSVFEDDELVEQDYPDITFTAKEIDKLLRADIYYLVRKFLNSLYESGELNTYSQIKLSGQSSKINIFMESLKEFLPGKKIKSGRIHSKGNDAEELKLLCLKGAILYLHALEKSNIEVTLKNDTKVIPISVYIKNENDEDKRMFEQGSDWGQLAERRRITKGGKEVYLHMRNADKEIGEPYKYVYENVEYKEISFEKLRKLSFEKICQEEIDNMPAEKRYIFVYLNKDEWGFNIVPVYKTDKGKIYSGPVEYCSFEMDILQDTFFDGRK